MRISTLLGILLFFVCSIANAKNIKPEKLIQNAKSNGYVFTTIQPFQLSTEKADEDLDLGKAIQKYDLLDVDLQQLKALSEEGPTAMSLKVPSSNTGLLELELVQVDIFSDDFTVVTGNSKEPVQVELGTHYRGIIKGTENSMVAVSFLNGEVMGLISTPQGNQVIGRLKDATTKGKHIIYDDKELVNELGISCQTPDDHKEGGYTKEELTFDGDLNKSVGDCIRLHIEVDHDIFLDKGGLEEATQFAAGLINEANTIYANEGISMVLSHLVIWTEPSPYSGSNSAQMLISFMNNTNEINGDLGQLLSYQASGGIAAGFSGLCNSNVNNSLSFSRIANYYESVPAFSWSVFVVTHEFGHLLGSRHTHACVWNGDNTAIDGCAGGTEGSCGLPGIPSQGGTIMSYCHNTGVGINFTEGFGEQPGNVIRNSVANAICTSPCSDEPDDIQDGQTGTCDDNIQNGDEEGIDCGGSNCEPCETIEPIITIIQEAAPDLCQGLVQLTAQVTNIDELTAPVLYNWSGGLGKTPTVIAYTNGTYTVTVTDALGQTANAIVVVNVDPSMMLGSYTLIGQEVVHTKNSVVHTGGVGVRNPGARAKIHHGSSINSFVKADIIKVKHNSTVAQEIFEFADLTLPPFKANELTGENVNVPNGTTVTLTGNAFGDIIVRKNATLIFTNSEIHINSLKVKAGARLEFMTPAEIRIAGNLIVNPTSIINPTAQQITFYAFEAKVKRGTAFNGNIYTTNRIIAQKATAETPTNMTGQFIALTKLKSKEFVNWTNGNNCIPSNLEGGADLVDYTPQDEITNDRNEDSEEPTRPEKEALSVFPNPTSDQLTIAFELANVEQAHFIITDLTGRVIRNLKVDAKATQQSFQLDVSNYPTGIYLLHLINAEEKLTKKFLVTEL